MTAPVAFLVKHSDLARDPALATGARGARKLVVTDLFEAKEFKAADVLWEPPAVGEKCPVHVMADSEVAVFNHRAVQDRHYHKVGTEIYAVLQGRMVIDVDGTDYSLAAGDMIVVTPRAVHEVKPDASEFLARVITLNCGGAKDKFVAPAT